MSAVSRSLPVETVHAVARRIPAHAPPRRGEIQSAAATLGAINLRRPGIDVSRILSLQRTVGNTAVNQMLMRSPLTDWLEAGLDLPSKIGNTTIDRSVGVGGVNDAGDLLVIQLRLTALGFNDTPLESAIRRYQSEVLRMTTPDGLVEPNGATLRALRAGQRAPAATGALMQRPSGGAIWAAYSVVSYDVLDQPEVWKLVGGRIGRTYGEAPTRPAQNTCACRVSYALNHGGASINAAPGAGKNDDGKRYITSARMLATYLAREWGTPDAQIRSNVEAQAFAKTLAPGEVAVFAGVHHAGLMKDGYADPYVFSDPSVMPMVAWKLP